MSNACAAPSLARTAATVDGMSCREAVFITTSRHISSDAPAAPVFRVLGIPPELAPLVLIRPLSGSAALAVGTELMQRYGVDSLIGRTAAVMLGSSETTFYTISVYFGAAGVRGTRYAVPAALIADLTGFCMAALSVRLFFRGCLCTFPDFSAIIVKLMT